MTRPPAYKWAFAARFRRHAFGWRSQPAVQRVRDAAAEIEKVAKKDPALAAAGADLFPEKANDVPRDLPHDCEEVPNQSAREGPR